MKLKTIAMTGVMSLAGLGLIGAGAHAVFTTTTASSQTINAGVPGVALYAAGATNTCTSYATAVAYPLTCNSITLPAQTVGSTFDANSTVNVVNVGTIPVTLVSFTVSDTPAVGYDLQSNLGLCIGGVYGLGYYGTGYLTNAESANPLSVGSPVTLPVGGTTSYQVDLYAGEASTQGCGAIAALPNSAVGESDTVTLTANYNG
ncbi:MAG: hypothetical protein ABSD97_00585 [Acidimicrobiales bacterium]|jgi:hypothetical protein